MHTICKSVVVSLPLVTEILGSSNTAFADWQGTVWGMSVEKADKSFRVPVPSEN
jgi:hypothetical protein